MRKADESDQKERKKRKKMRKLTRKVARKIKLLAQGPVVCGTEEWRARYTEWVPPEESPSRRCMR